MEYVLLLILISTIVVSLIAFIGIFTLALKKQLLKKILIILVGFAAGGLIGGAFLHLLPESLESGSALSVFTSLILGFILFFLIERVLFWRHCHKGVCKVHTFTYMNLIGDGVHNFIDGLVIAAAFLTNIKLGWITTLAIIFHEVPQEIGDFGVLVYGGFKRITALFFNYLTAILAVAGGIVGYFLHSYMEGMTVFLLAFAAGGFIYIASSDLIPELHKEADFRKSMMSFIFFVIGVLLMALLKVSFS
ncbi:ZIP family metal transporter [Candidatus Woesearchaeota archaeon]|nr:ZIP family metal transporter [Candidatus Woesearchaeota archaeon]